MIKTHETSRPAWLSFTIALIVALGLGSIIASCGGGGGSAPVATSPPPPSPPPPPTPPPPPPPPPPGAQNPGGIWFGPAVTVAAADVFTSFETPAIGGFSVGTSPYTADFSSGNAQTIGNLAFYISGTHS